MIEKSKCFDHYVHKIAACCLLFVVSMGIIIGITGCKKKNDIPIFKYDELENGNIKITSLTDKGKNTGNVVIPSELDGKKVEIIGSELFKGDDIVQEIEIQDGIKKIEDNAFIDCINLSKISFPASVEEIGRNIVYNTKWEKNSLNNNNEIIVNDILIEVKSGLKSYKIPENVKILVAGLFYENDVLEEIILDPLLENIGNYSFYKCTKLSEVKIPDNVKVIGYAAFSGCEQLKISVPSAVNTIYPEAFNNVEQVNYR